jgi:hypothetical protein
MNKSVLRAVGLISTGLALGVIVILAEEAPRNANAKQDVSEHSRSSILLPGVMDGRDRAAGRSL